VPQMRCLKARAAKTGPGVVGASSAMALVLSGGFLVEVRDLIENLGMFRAYADPFTFWSSRSC